MILAGLTQLYFIAIKFRSNSKFLLTLSLIISNTQIEGSSFKNQHVSFQIHAHISNINNYVYMKRHLVFYDIFCFSDGKMLANYKIENVHCTIYNFCSMKKVMNSLLQIIFPWMDLTEILELLNLNEKIFSSPKMKTCSTYLF